MQDAQKQLLDTLKQANNVLVTVSRDPSVDQLAALIGLTLILNKQGKHAAAVFSGEVPSTLEFLQPEATIEKNTDSLRDFIIALDKSKADKLRYKVEDNVVRIFITPYKTSISEDDLDFSQGDFNVEAVVALGVHSQEDLDEAITAHGRILHDAKLTSINVSAEGGLGTINWHVPEASSLSELITELAESIDPKLIDEQIATALLTGIVAETDRFRNEKTRSNTMSASATLMAAGANQQLVAQKLEEPAHSLRENQESTDTEDGSLNIEHADKGEDQADTDSAVEDMPLELPSPEPSDDEASEDERSGDTPEADLTAGHVSSGPKLVTQPPTLGGTLTANSREEQLDPVTDPLSLPASEPPVLSPPPPAWMPPQTTPQAQPQAGPTAGEQADTPPAPSQTLTELEASVAGTTPKTDQPDSHIDTARDEVSRALSEAAAAGSAPPEPIQALNAQPMAENLNAAEPAPVEQTAPPAAPWENNDPGPPPAPALPAAPDLQTPTTAEPPASLAPSPPTPQVADPTAPPPVPPPIPFQFGNPPS